MPPPRLAEGLLAQLKNISISSRQLSAPTPRLRPAICRRHFSSTPSNLDWLLPKKGTGNKKTHKGRPRVHTGGSTRGTTVVWGDYGIRMVDFHRRISAAQLKIGEETIKRRLRGMQFRLYRRVAANIAVYKKGNESRMGTGKGGFDHWASRVAVNRIIFELKGAVHEQVVRDAFRLAGNKLPGTYEFARKGDPPIMGVTKVAGDVTVDSLMRPRVKLPLEQTAARLPATTPP